MGRANCRTSASGDEIDPNSTPYVFVRDPEPILNLTQHDATPEQLQAGVVDLPVNGKKFLRETITFNHLPATEEIVQVAAVIAEIANSTSEEEFSGVKVMIGSGLPALQAPLERALRDLDFDPIYAFSLRESVDQPQPDGSVRKVAVFKHVGFTPAVPEPE